MDRACHPCQQFRPLNARQLRMTLTVADTRELVGWILSFGSGVRVIRPTKLNDAVADEAKTIYRNATQPATE